MPTNHNDRDTRSSLTRPASNDPIDPGPGYEVSDVNIGGVLVFLSGLAGFLLIFFVFCFVMGKVINSAFTKEDGPPTKWTEAQMSDPHNGASSGSPAGGKRQNLAPNPEMQQRELQHVSNTFPQPRLDIDDSNQSLADLHAREDLLLGYYSSSQNDGGAIRIPIDRAMELIAQRGLPVVSQAAGTNAGPQFVGDAKSAITQPLTSGFARTGYELDVMEARAQKLSYGAAEGTEHAQLGQVH